MDYARFNYVAQPGDHAHLFPKFGPYDYFAVEWGYNPLPSSGTCDDEAAELQRMAARQLTDPMLRFGGEDELADLDPQVNMHVLSDDPIAAADLGLRNIDRVAAMLVPATTRTGPDYSRLTELYHALVLQRHRELAAVAKLVGGVEETRYRGGRGGVPYVGVPAAQQRAAVQFLIRRGFARPNAFFDVDLLRRVAPAGSTNALHGSNIALLNRLINADVFYRMAENEAINPRPSYTGADLLIALNEGLFEELNANKPVVGLYRRELQRNYVMVLLTGLGLVREPQLRPEPPASPNDEPFRVDDRRATELLTSILAEGALQYRSAKQRPSEFKAALREGVSHLLSKLDRGLRKVQDPRTAAHLRDLQADLQGKGPTAPR
jgi:hypothetical protein